VSRVRVEFDEAGEVREYELHDPAPWRAQTWPEFRDETSEAHRWLVDGLLPAGMLAFVAGPPKKGKTWLGLALALALATGRPLFDVYTVPAACNVLYVALEGSRVGLRTRIGALARGLELDPDGDDLERLTMLYRPRPFDLVELKTATWLRVEAEERDAKLVVVDVLRAAARFQENVAEDFARVRDSLEPLLAAERTVALLHHFGKLTETQKERSPGERMAGTGAMYGALDVGLLITRSEGGARRLRVDVEARDFAAPEALGVVIAGTGSGEHGGFTYTDAATLTLDPTAAEERDLVGELETLLADGTWRTQTELAAKQDGIGANRNDVGEALEGSPERFAVVEGPRVGRHANARPWGTVAMLRELEERERLARAAEPDGPDARDELPELVGRTSVSPYRGEPDETDVRPSEQSGAEPSSQTSQTADEELDEDEVERLAELAADVIENERRRGTGTDPDRRAGKRGRTK
jgi:AAA domain